MTSTQPATGTKHDADKAPLDLLDPYALTKIAEVLDFGKQKYAAHNWRGGIQICRLLASSMRHLLAIMAGQNTDPESGLTHAAHLGCNAMFLIWMMEHRPDLDDRWRDNPPG